MAVSTVIGPGLALYFGSNTTRAHYVVHELPVCEVAVNVVTSVKVPATHLLTANCRATENTSKAPAARRYAPRAAWDSVPLATGPRPVTAGGFAAGDCPFESHPTANRTAPHTSPPSSLALKSARDSLARATRSLRLLVGTRHRRLSINNTSDSGSVCKFRRRGSASAFGRGRAARYADSTRPTRSLAAVAARS